MVELNGQQADALAKIQKWYEDQLGWASEPFRLFGYAGTGKTTLAGRVGDALGVQPAFGAYTGKAAKVLRTKGVAASTIHSAIYRPMGTAETQRALAKAREDLAAANEMGEAHADLIAELEAEVAALEREARTVGFTLNPDSEWAAAPLIILDEVSMVNTKIGQDIESFGVPVLVLGDPAQLPPVEGGGYYTNGTPDVMLTDIQRQAAESPVLELATRIRGGGGLDGVGLTSADLTKVSLDEAMAADQVLVWKNATRWTLTEAIRKRLDRPQGRPVVGDRVMCLTNNSTMGVLNGTQYDVLDVEPGPIGPRLLLDEIDSDRPPRWLNAYNEGFQGLQWESMMKRGFGAHKGNRGAFTFANVITVHKAQGSEWPSVYVVDQSAGVMAMAAKEMSRAMAVDQGRRWLYTAVTRAVDHVTIARR